MIRIFVLKICPQTQDIFHQPLICLINTSFFHLFFVFIYIFVKWFHIATSVFLTAVFGTTTRWPAPWSSKVMPAGERMWFLPDTKQGVIFYMLWIIGARCIGNLSNAAYEHIIFSHTGDKSILFPHSIKIFVCRNALLIPNFRSYPSGILSCIFYRYA